VQIAAVFGDCLVHHPWSHKQIRSCGRAFHVFHLSLGIILARAGKES
jgi:hypothetical protein